MKGEGRKGGLRNKNRTDPLVKMQRCTSGTLVSVVYGGHCEDAHLDV